MQTISKFMSFFGLGGVQVQPALPVVFSAQQETGAHHAPAYPPTDPGIDYETVEAVVASQSDLIDKIMKAAALDTESQKFIPELIINYAAYVHLLPATRSEQFPGKGGLFRMGLEVGFYSLRASHGVIFAREIAEVRVKTVPRWRIATFVAGLLADTYRAVTSLHVINENGLKWNPFVESLAKYLERNSVKKYYIKWTNALEDNQNQAFNNLVIGAVVPPALLAYLAETGPQVIGGMLEAITGTGTTPLSLAVQKTRHGLIKRDVQANPNFIGKPMMGSHLEAHLVDVMRKMVREGRWKANIAGQPLWNAPDGLFLIIQTSWKDIYSGLMSGGFTGIPTDYSVIADVLIKAGVIILNPAGGYVYELKLPNLGKNAFEAVKLSSGIKAFGDAYQGFEKLDTPILMSPLITNQDNEEAKQEIKPKIEKQPALSVSAPVPAPVNTQKNQNTSKQNQEINDDSPPDLNGINIIDFIEELEELKDVGESNDKELEVSIPLSKENGLTEGAHIEVSLNAQWTRYAKKMPEPISSWIEKTVKDVLAGTITCSINSDAYGIPASLIDEAGLSRAELLSIIVREGLIWLPAGHKKKLVDVDNVPHIFFNKRFFDEITK